MTATHALADILLWTRDAIASAGPAGISAGELYSALTAFGFDFAAYEALESLLVNQGLVTMRGQRLYAERP